MDDFTDLMEVFGEEQLPHDRLLCSLKKLVGFFSTLDLFWDCECDSTLVSHRLEFLHELLVNYFVDVESVTGTPEGFVPRRDLKGAEVSPLKLETKTVLAGKITPVKGQGEPHCWIETLFFWQGQLIWILMVLVLAGSLYQFHHDYKIVEGEQVSETAPRIIDMSGNDSFLRERTPWWSVEYLDDSDETLKHRRSLLEGPLVSHSFGDGISMHANQETRLSDFLFGLMIVEAFCVWLLSLYPPLAQYKKEIIGGGHSVLFFDLYPYECGIFLPGLVPPTNGEIACCE